MSNPVKVQEDEDVRMSSQLVESSSQNQLDPSSQQLVEEDFSNDHAGAGNEEDCRMAIVPVIARNRRTSARKETYAFHDTGSSITFITEQLIKELGLKGKKMKLTILTMGVPLIMVTEMITDLEILGLDRQYAVVIPVAYSKEQMPVTSRHIPTEEDIRCWPHLRNIKMPKIEADVGILIGNNVSDAYSPFEVITGPPGSPHATRTRLGWIFWCVKRRSKGDKHMVNKAEIMAVEELETLNGLKEMVKSSINLDFPEHLADEKREYSLQDKLFIEKTQNSITFVDQHYQVALPFKYDVKLPNNRPLAEQRLRSLQRKMFKSETYREDYIKFMSNMLDKDYASLVPKEDLDRQDGRVWFVPHHGTYKKPDKIRIVFDCSSVYQGISLNKLLLPGPDLTNTLLGVLLRFRLEPVAIMGDVEAMFHQVRIPPSDMDFLRFLWWPEGNADLPAESYRMKVHLFGAVSSPSCANTALRKTAEDHEQEYPDEIINCILRNFYVDDLLKSVPTEAEAIFIYNNLTELLAKGGFKLTKWVSNRRTVIEAISVEDRANNVKNINLDKENLPSDRALGVFWSIEEDCFEFKVNIPERCFTRRSILSFVCSIFDPIGLISPFILPAKCILQNLCQHGFSWDDPIDEVNLKKWEKWLTDISGIKEFKTPRCIKPEHFGELKLKELHCFSDSSNYGYGCCIYLRLVNQQAAVHCSLILGKSRVSPLKKITIPRMELMAATMSLKISQVILREIDVPIDRVHYWTDSMSVIRYINNDSTRFHTFVANRLSVIHQCSNPSQWHYCKSEDNPSDLASRGISTKDQSKIEFWLNGPEFLLQTTKEWPVSDVLKDCAELSAEDPEVKIIQCAVVKTETAMDQLINHYSNWFKVKKAVAWWKQFICLFKVWVRRRKRLKEDKLDQDQINREIDKGRRRDLHMLKLKVSDIEDAELDIIKHVQHLHFSEEIESIRNGTAVKKNSPIRRLDPIIENGLLLVGGRLNRAKLPYTAKHPVILPKCTQASKLILEQFHKINGHLGRNSMLSDLRQKYWILSANSAVRSLVRNCVICRRYQSKVCEQKMSNLPSDRLIAGEKAFTRTGMDFFGPFIVRRGRTDHKRYGVVFTCLATRAVHLEVAHTLDTDSCINAIRRCMARRGRISVLRCDNGTNLIGAQRELKAEIDKWNQSVIHQTMLQENIKFEFSPPTGSHFGGIWERIIRTVRKILYSLLQEQSIKLDDESLQTLFCEIEYIINRRPITHVSSDPKDLEALTPSHLLLSFSGQYLPPGVFDKKDCFVRRKWKQIQYISDVFWRRWQKEYLPLLQERQKWFNPKRNVKVGDLVLVVDNTLPRNSWLLGRVVEVKPDNKGLVRIVRVKTKSSEIDRPVDKLVLILEADT